MQFQIFLNKFVEFEENTAEQFQTIKISNWNTHSTPSNRNKVMHYISKSAQTMSYY